MQWVREPTSNPGAALGAAYHGTCLCNYYFLLAKWLQTGSCWPCCTCASAQQSNLGCTTVQMPVPYTDTAAGASATTGSPCKQCTIMVFQLH